MVEEEESKKDLAEGKTEEEKPKGTLDPTSTPDPTPAQELSPEPEPPSPTPEPEPTPPTPEPEVESEPMEYTFTQCYKIMYATADTQLFWYPDGSGGNYGTLRSGEAVPIYAKCDQTNYYQIIRGGYVCGDNLSEALLLQLVAR